MTRANRYPELFTFLKHTLADVTSLRLLSYGCSTGEEVFSLRALFPTADITGVDINPHSISVAERHLAQHPSPGIAFECASSPAGLPAGHYDAILCMAVLQHGALRQNPPSSCADYIRFADVAAIVTGLAHCLKPGGLLVIWNSHFRFADMPAAAGFDTVWQVPPQLAGDTLYYGPDNIRLTGDNGGIDYYGDIVFRKRNCQPGPL